MERNEYVVGADVTRGKIVLVWLTEAELEVFRFVADELGIDYGVSAVAQEVA